MGPSGRIGYILHILDSVADPETSRGGGGGGGGGGGEFAN